MQFLSGKTRANLKPWGVWAALLAVLLGLSGCQRAPRAAQGLDPACLAGTWQVMNMARTLGDALARSEPPFAVEAVGGAVRYHFSEDGLLEITFDGLEVHLLGEVEGEKLRVSNRFDGAAAAQYQVDVFAQEIELSHFGGAGVLFRLELDDQLLAEGDFPAWQAFTSALNGGTAAAQDEAPTRVVERARAAAHCRGDTLAIQTLDPLPGPRVELERAP